MTAIDKLISLEVVEGVAKFLYTSLRIEIFLQANDLPVVAKVMNGKCVSVDLSFNTAETSKQECPI